MNFTKFKVRIRLGIFTVHKQGTVLKNSELRSRILQDIILELAVQWYSLGSINTYFMHTVQCTACEIMDVSQNVQQTFFLPHPRLSKMSIGQCTVFLSHI